MVFDPLAGGGARRSEELRDAARHPSGGAAALHAAAVEPSCPGMVMAALGRGRALRHRQSRLARRAALARATTVSCATGWPSSSPTRSTARARSGRSSLIEGLEHGRWALGLKVHHCLVDGIGSVDVDRRAARHRARSRVSPPCRTTAPRRTARRSWLRPPRRWFRRPAPDCTRRAPACAQRCTRPRRSSARWPSPCWFVRRSPARRGPRSTCRSGRPDGTRSCVCRSHELKAIAPRPRRLGQRRRPRRLHRRPAAAARGPRRAATRTRPAGDGADERPGHHRGGAARQPGHLAVRRPAGPGARSGASALRAIAASTRRLKADGGSAVPADAVIDLAALAPPVVVHAALARTAFARRLFNVTITNVPGHEQPLYAFGAQLREVLPVVPLAAEHSVGIAIFSYNGVVTFGVMRRLQRDPGPRRSGLRDRGGARRAPLARAAHRRNHSRNEDLMSVRVAINGFGRIGRCCPARRARERRRHRGRRGQRPGRRGHARPSAEVRLGVRPLPRRGRGRQRRPRRRRQPHAARSPRAIRLALPWSELDVDVVIESTGDSARARPRRSTSRRAPQGDHLGADQGR